MAFSSTYTAERCISMVMLWTMRAIEHTFEYEEPNKAIKTLSKIMIVRMLHPLQFRQIYQS